MIMRILSSSGLFIIAFLLVAITNIVVILGIQANHSSELTSQITLSERELQLPYYGSIRENNGIALRMVYRVFNNDENSTYSNYNNPAWLNREKLSTLGFDVDKYVDAKYPKLSIPKEVFLVLENDGEAYKSSLKRVKEKLLKDKALFDETPTARVKRNYERTEKELQRESRFASRLFVIDAGSEYMRLREQYSDKSRYLIVKGVVQLIYNEHKKRVYGYIQELSIRSVHVPLEHKSIFHKLEYNHEVEPRYSVVLHYGSRYEPWIVSVDALTAQ